MMSQKQHETVDYISEFTEVKGYPPTNVEVGKWFGITAQAAGRRIKRLENRGFVRRTPGVMRSVRVSGRKRR